ncbi:uncharacterized protein [Triticum aestivum]|uniref:uncharacterized protein n=1 Tax=Triticum aestivum TaxID=4565 RepID=UPI001D0329D9|nr:uncharacterized protein LOC123120694 [Triticum aestivum]
MYHINIQIVKEDGIRETQYSPQIQSATKLSQHAGQKYKKPNSKYGKKRGITHRSGEAGRGAWLLGVSRLQGASGPRRGTGGGGKKCRRVGWRRGTKKRSEGHGRLSFSRLLVCLARGRVAPRFLRRFHAWCAFLGARSVVCRHRPWKVERTLCGPSVGHGLLDAHTVRGEEDGRLSPAQASAGEIPESHRLLVPAADRILLCCRRRSGGGGRETSARRSWALTQKCPPTTARSHPLELTLSFPSHPPGHPSLAPLQIPVVAGLSSPSSPLSHPASSLSPHHRATPFPPTARNPPPVGQNLDFLGAGDELLAGGGAGSACFDAGDEATWIRAGCCWRTSGCGWTWCGASARCWPTTRRAPPRCGTPGAHPERRRCRGLVRPPLPRPPRPWVPLAARPRACAVYASNDAAFTDEEFASIPRIGGRKKSSQAWKTGSKMGASYTLYRC